MDVNTLLKDFLEVCRISQIPINLEEILVVQLMPGATHKPGRLPREYMAVYIFEHGTQCLKVGKVGVNSNARYQSHHYNPDSSKSNLAKSLMDDYDVNATFMDGFDVSTWIKENTTRTDLLLHGSKGIAVLNLLESFVQCRLKPKYEGFLSQRLI